MIKTALYLHYDMSYFAFLSRINNLIKVLEKENNERKRVEKLFQVSSENQAVSFGSYTNLHAVMHTPVNF